VTIVDAPALHDAASGTLTEAVELRRRIHRTPELGLHLPATQAAVLDALSGLDLDVRTGGSTSSVVADLVGPTDGPTVLLRADMDALPMPEDTDLAFCSEVSGAMHACGHDAHVAMLVGAARVLAGLRASLPGRIRFMFQPGEEGHHGARLMIEEGVLDGVDAAFAIHVTPNLPSGFVAGRAGAFLASADEVRIEVRGRGGHASTPHLANDPIPIACEIVSALQTLVTRRVNVFDPAVVTIASIHSGTTTNVVPEVAEMLGTIRTTSEGARAHVHAGIERVVAGVAAAHDVTAVTEITRGYPVTVNDAVFSERVAGISRRVLGDDRYIDMPSPAMGAEDFSYVLKKVQGAMVFLGVCPEGADPSKAAGCHSNRMVLNEDAMAAGIALNVAVALDILENDDREPADA
jgi:hippurate hydrolase